MNISDRPLHLNNAPSTPEHLSSERLIIMRGVLKCRNSIQTRADPGRYLGWSPSLFAPGLTALRGGATVHPELGMLQRDDDPGPCGPANYRDG